MHEMLRHFLEATNSRYLFKIDPDTRIFKKFKKLPDYSAVFGTVQHQETLFSIQGGCIGFTRDVAEHLCETRYFLHPDFARKCPPWCLNQALLNRPFYKGLTSFDWLIGWACRECNIRMIDWPEIYSQWLPPVPEGVEEKFAIAHPFK